MRAVLERRRAADCETDLLHFSRETSLVQGVLVTFTEIKGKYTSGFGVSSSIFLYCSVWMDDSNLQSRL
jgi:hypothetical protein